MAEQGFYAYWCALGEEGQEKLRQEVYAARIAQGLPAKGIDPVALEVTAQGMRAALAILAERGTEAA